MIAGNSTATGMVTPSTTGNAAENTDSTAQQSNDVEVDTEGAITLAIGGDGGGSLPNAAGAGGSGRLLATTGSTATVAAASDPAKATTKTSDDGTGTQDPKAAAGQDLKGEDRDS